MNGEADSTVLVSSTTLDAETVGAASAGLTGTVYLNDVVRPALFCDTTSVTTNAHRARDLMSFYGCQGAGVLSVLTLP